MDIETTKSILEIITLLMGIIAGLYAFWEWVKSKEISWTFIGGTLGAIIGGTLGAALWGIAGGVIGAIVWGIIGGIIGRFAWAILMKILVAIVASSTSSLIK